MRIIGKTEGNKSVSRLSLCEKEEFGKTM